MCCVREEKSSFLTVCYWNIHGWRSKIVGNKLVDPEFLQKISKFDIVSLAELHCENEVSLPGYKNIKQKIRDKKYEGPKIAGGIGVFVREKYVEMVELMPNSNPDSIWIKIKKGKSGELEDIYIGSYYVSPEGKNSKRKIDFFSSVNEEVNLFNKKGVVLIQGDLNARVGREPDFVEFDKSDDYFGIENLTNQSQRNSEDKTSNTRGKDLLDLCKVNDLLIANGRKPGDIFGKYTSHQYNGSAVNDYMLMSNYFEHKIFKFTVGDYAPWLSDHCPISTFMALNNLLQGGNKEEELNDTEPVLFLTSVTLGGYIVPPPQ